MLYNTLRRYEYIVAIADAQSICDAAERIGVSQPSLSVAITQIETTLGARIFERRRGSKLVITPFGHQFIKRARALLEQARELEQINSDTLPFVFGCFADVAPWYLGTALETLRSELVGRACKGIEGRFAELSHWLAVGKIHLALSYDIGFPASFEQQTVAQVSPVAFVSDSHPLARRSKIELNELLPYALIVFSEPESDAFMQHLFKGMGLNAEIVEKVTSLELMRSLAARGFGVGISYTAPPGDHSYDGESLVTLPIVTHEAKADLKLVWPHHLSDDTDLQRAIRAIASLIQ